METDFGGASAIFWSQTEIDELEAAPLETLAIGAAWSWRGRIIQLNSPVEAQQFGSQPGWGAREDAEGRGALRSVIRNVRSAGTVGFSLQGVSAHVTITNGARSYAMLLVETRQYLEPMLVFNGEVPPKGQDFWVSGITRFSAGETDVARTGASGVTFLQAARIDAAGQEGQDPEPVSRPNLG